MPVVTVLWALALLTAIATSLLWSASVSYGLARNDLELAAINAMVEAGMNLAIDGMLDPRPDRRWPTDGRPHDASFDGTRIKITIQDELGRIDLNQADTSLLVGLLRSTGLDVNAANNLAEKIVDWRTATSLKHLNGAKERDYAERGSGYRPRNGPFQSVDELLLVMDVTPELYRKIAPALTVYSGRQFVDPQVAPPEVMRVLPGMTPESVQSALAVRQNGPPIMDALAGDVLAYMRGRAFTIRTEFVRSSRAIATEVTIRLTENPNQPYWVLNWRSK
ncbi:MULTISPECIES: type II secretion system protein GspK [unclassified Bradyrhizobium]|uniref:general secretion pathway protein GspK n=1 Tax=unclassified Bradyrhizobium TaxID=2631580 RepID=UPI0028E7FE0D|nr:MULTISPECIES: type II secretion system protein GspK [unclassified Bradyrhizobium]